MSTEKNLNNLVINKVENKTVYDYMKSNNLINADELYFVTGADENATETESGLMSAEDKVKLNGIQDGAEQNVQADWNVTDVNSDAYIKNKPTTLPADGGDSDTVNGHTVEANVPADAKFTDTVYTHPNYTAKTNGLYKITVDDTGHVSATNAVTKTDITALGIPAQDTTYSAAGTSLGLVKSGGDVTITSGVITVSDDSHNHVIGNIDNLQATLDSKVDKVNGKGLSTNDLTATLKSNYDTAYTHSQQAHAPANAEKNVIVGIQKNGTDLTVNSSTRKVNITVPTKTSELTNDSNFATTTALNAKVDKVDGKGLSTNDYTTTEKTKLSGIAEGAEVNQNAFSNVVVGSVTVAADSKTDTLTLVAGDNVTLTPDSTNDKITIASKDTVYTHPSYTSKSSGLYKITVDGTGHVSGTAAVVKSDITGLGIPAQDTTYSEATTSAAGLMSASDKSKLDGLQDMFDSKADVVNGQYTVTTAGNGAAYTATVTGITSLTAGVSFIMVPHVVSTSTDPTLDVNGLGAKTIRRRLSAIATGVQSGYTTSWLAVNTPYRVIYDGTYWIVEGNTKPSASDLYGAVPVEKAGVATGGTAGQVLAKKSGTDYDVEWITPAAEITTDATLTQSGAAADAKAVGDALANIVTDVYSASTTAPSNTKLLWIDTGNGGIMKYYNGSAWVAVASTWG